ncbi:MAG TPA: hypothetical protein VNT52_18560, partial [Acidimicrobiales bacterium]|nr:hypothetical protein [Acidimicrobiales bacterium]
VGEVAGVQAVHVVGALGLEPGGHGVVLSDDLVGKDRVGGVNTAVAVLNAANAVFADKIVAENDAMTAWFEAQRSHYMNGLNAGYLADVKSGLCTV